MAREVIVDTNIMVGLLIPNDNHHEECKAIFERLPKPVMVHVLTIAETAHFLEDRIGPEAEFRFLQQVRDGSEIIPYYHAEDWDDICGVAERYLTSALGTIDAAVVIAAERHGATIATMDNLMRTVVTPKTPWFDVIP